MLSLVVLLFAFFDSGVTTDIDMRTTSTSLVENIADTICI